MRDPRASSAAIAPLCSMGCARPLSVGSPPVVASIQGVPVSRVQDLFDLSDRVAVLTGVGSGIGKATARMLSAAGATIVGGDIDEAGAQATADEIKADGGSAIVRRTDVTKRSDVDALVDLAVSEHGRLDIMGNIAGVPHNKLVAECTDEE